VASIVPTARTRRFIVSGIVDGKHCQILLDSGASACVTSKRIASRVSNEKSVLVGADGGRMNSIGQSQSIVELNNVKKTLPVYVLERMNADYDMILGCNGLRSFGIVLDFINDEVIYSESQTKVAELVCDAGQSNLTPKQQEELAVLLEDFADIFEPIRPGSATGVTHEINLNDGEKPIYRKPYRMPFTKKNVVEEEVAKMLKNGVVRSSKSPWSSPVVLVVKKDGSNRFCVDYTALNKITKKDKHPMPKIDEVLREVKGARYFSTMDLQSGYWQVPMAEKDVEKTAFSTDEGHYEFVVLPFGLTNAPATFQRYMRNVLQEIKNVKSVIDDILVFTNEWEEHLKTLRLVFEELRLANLRVKMKKCHFGLPEVKWVGHIIDSEGVRVDPSKTKAINDYPCPRNEKELRSFLGMANYYRKFVRNFSTIASPLYNLTKKSVKWIWGSVEDAAFGKLKMALVSSDVLVNPDFTKPYRLYTDASNIGMGAVLCQVQSDEERVICYASQHFSTHEKNYSTIEREAGAIIWALRTFHVYLHGAEFEILSDHAPLQWLASKKDATGRLARWQYQLMDYPGLTGISHIKGKENIVADTLSRIPEILAIDPSMTDENFRSLQEEDPEFEKLRCSMILKRVWRKDGKIFIPAVMVEKVLKSFHGCGIHFGVSKTLQLLQFSLFWPGMQVDVEEFIKKCAICQITKPIAPKPAPLQSLPPVDKPMHRIAIDYCGPFQVSENGNKYLLVAIDHFSRYLYAFPVPEATTEISVRCVEKFVSIEGTPKEILSDQGTHFTGEFFQSFLRNHGIKHLRTSAGRPQCDGMVERQMRSLKSFIRADLLERTDLTSISWDKNIEKMVTALNKTIHPSTGHTPFEIARGRKAGEVRFSWMNTSDDVQQMQTSWADISSKNEEQLEKGRKRYEEKKKMRNFEIGQKVWKKINQPQGLKPKYYGPYEILKKIGQVNYEIGGVVGVPTKIVHVDHLLPARNSERTKYYPNPRGRPPGRGE
jgi:hypothetical protein